MNKSIQKLKLILEETKIMEENQLYEEVFKRYKDIINDIEEMRYIISETSKQDREIVADVYSSFAYLLFSFSEYSYFFEMYIKAQKYGYSFEKRRKFIYEAFIEPNIDNFKSNYKMNIENMNKNGPITEFIEFEDLTYWLLTTGNKNEYYLYEKEMDLIREKFTLDVSNDKLKDIDLYSSFSDHLILNNGSWIEVQDNIKQIVLNGKKVYLIENNIERLFSYFQGDIIEEFYLSNLIIFKDITKLKEYFINSSHYLPRTLIGIDKKNIEFSNVIDEIHEYRLNKDNRLGDNILLSICIPSYNRGERAYKNVIHTLQSTLDEEIEVVLSNNGTKNDTREFYEKISQIGDPRLTYFEFDENQGMALNFCKAAELAKGRYILLLSDEDLLDLNKLELVVNSLKNKNNIAIARVGSDKQGLVPYIGWTEQGKDSLLKYMLTSNYMSGNIYNRELLVKYNLIEYIKTNLDNQACLYYPHMVWDLILYQYGRVLGWDITLINEGEAEKTEFDITEMGVEGKKTMPYYATLEGRLGQHKGFYDVIKDLEICKEDFYILREAYKRLSGKTIFLVSLSIRVYYRQTGINTDELLEAAYDDSIKYLEDIYEGKKNHNKYKYEEDIKEINGYYEYYKNQC